MSESTSVNEADSGFEVRTCYVRRRNAWLARAGIREALERSGWVEGRDFLMCA